MSVIIKQMRKGSISDKKIFEGNNDIDSFHQRGIFVYDSMPDLGEIRVYQRADFQSGSRVLKKVF